MYDIENFYSCILYLIIASCLFFQQSLSQAEESSENGIPGLEPPAEEEETTDKNGEIEAEIVIDEDDDEVKETDKPEESPAAIEEKPTVEEETAPKEDEEDDDDDVIIHEVIPERIILDDDDGKDEEYVPQNIPKREIVIKEEPIDDGFMDVEGGVLKLGNIKIKEEPIDLGKFSLDCHFSFSFRSFILNFISFSIC